MNYGKKQASKKQKEITSKSTMRKKKVGVRFFKVALVCILLLGVTCAVGGGLFIKKIVDDTPQVSPADIKPKGYTTFVYAADGSTETERFVSSGSNRIYKTIDEIPDFLAHAFVAIEDERFYQHNGIDMQGIARAAVVGIANGGDFSEGASTLTQQLIKNNVFPNFTEEKTFYDKVERKIQEQFLAVEIEKQVDKNTILELYMNTINLGQNSLGVQSASRRYFNKDVSDLTLSEATVIAGITQSPSKLNPVTNPEENAKRRKKVLNNMLKQKYIDQAAYDEALADPVYDRVQNINSALEEDSPSTYFIDSLANQVMADLTEKLGYSDTQAYNAVYSSGLSIYSTQDLNIQQICDEEMNDDGNFPSSKMTGVSYALTITRADGSVENYGTTHLKAFRKANYGDKQGLLYADEEAATAAVEEFKASIAQEGDTYDEKLSFSPQPQASVVIMDQSNGQVKALVGGRGAKVASQSLNRATATKRQPGSCYKIVSTYAPALDSCGQTLATVIKDEPYSYENGRPVKNWWGSSYRGNMTMRKAIEQSANICAVKTITEITPQVGFNYLKNFGFSTLVENEERNGQVFSDVQQALALGGITDGVYNIEMAGAYATIANGGVYNKPILYTKIVDHDGNVLLDNTPETHTVLQDSTAWLLTSAMEGVITDGTAKNARLDNMPAAGKTGTTSSDVDIWFCGFTPYYTGTVWLGYDENKPLTEKVAHLHLWRKIMNRIHENLEYKDFPMPASIEEKTICTLTGKLAVSGCPAITEFFANGSVPSQSCSGHAGTGYGEENQEEVPPEGTVPEVPTTPAPETPAPPVTPPAPTEPTPPVDPPAPPVDPPTP
ncbi:MAG: PBP1A family penicillin-binding protein [Lachnospiraceae bacterium]